MYCVVRSPVLFVLSEGRHSFGQDREYKSLDVNLFVSIIGLGYQFNYPNLFYRVMCLEIYL